MTQTGGRTRSSALLLAVLLLAGLGMRLAVLPTDATGRVDVWKVWSHSALIEGVAPLYATDERTRARRLLEYDGRRSPIASPPGLLYTLELAGRLYQERDPAVRDGPWFTAAVKLPSLLAELLLAALIYAAVRRIVDADMARWSLLAYWLNPAIVLSAACLGFLAPLFVLPAIGSLIFATWGYPAVAGVLFAAALLTDLHVVWLLPALALALGRRATLRAEAYTWATGAGVLTAIGILTPLAAAGTLPSALRLFLSGLPIAATRERMIAMWDALPAGLRGVETAASAASSSAVGGDAAEQGLLSTVVDSITANPASVVIPTLAVLALWAMWRGRAVRFLPGWAGLAAVLAHLASLPGVASSPNALFPVIAFLTIAAAESVRYRPLVIALSLLLAINLGVFAGIDAVALPPWVTGTADPAMVLTAVSGLLALWHIWIFNGECGRETPRLRMRAEEARHALLARGTW